MRGDLTLAEKFSDVSMFRTCEQCGCCSSACPITGVNGFNVRQIVRHIELDLIDEIAETPYPWGCTTCGRCEGVCPNGIAILDIIRPLRSMSPEEFVPAAPVPCTNACPAGIDVPGYVRLIAQGKEDEACQLILEKVPFPGILGRVCTHPCEDSCRRGDVNEAISICALKRFAADKAGGLPEGGLKVADDTGHKVAIIGAGPAGLTAGFYLRKMGHQVTIFEARPKPGGMMRYGIPYYRLPEDVLEREIDHILGLGIELKTGKALDKNFDPGQLKEEGFEAVFMALGLQRSRRIELEGAGLDDVFWGIDFLTEVNEGKEIGLKERVLVVGGGNVAVDVALTALRVGATDVTLACLESREEMPANPWEIEMALEEGVRLLPSWGPQRIMGENGRVTGIELVRCSSVFDDDGNFCPAFDDTKETVEADQVILAIGQTADLSCLGGKESYKVEKDLIVVDPETHQTDLPGVFAGGDVVTGPGTIVEAIAAGRGAASSIDRFLGGGGKVSESREQRAESRIGNQQYDGKREKGFADLGRTEAPTLSLSERHEGFPEVDLCFSEDQAIMEAKRCLQCDLELALAGRDQDG